MQLGLGSTGPLLQAWNGTGDWTHGKKLRSIRALFPMSDTPLVFLVFKNSGIQSVADMANKRVGVGPAGSSGGTFAPEIFKALGIPATLRVGAFDASGAQMRSQQIDVLLGWNAIPSPTFTELDTTERVQYIPLTATEIAKLRASIPELSSSVVPAGSYPSMTTDYTTVGFFNFTVASKDLPDDLVYAIVKAFYANHDRMVAAHPSARPSVVENLKRNEFLPYHPGAVRYYREIGVEIPAALAAVQ